MSNTNEHNDWISLGLLAEKRILAGDIDGAKSLLGSSIALKPNEAWPYLLLASIVEDNDEAIELIRLTKNIDITEWYYINLIEKYAMQIDILKEDFLTKYHPSTLKDASAIVHWRQLRGFQDFVLPANKICINDLHSIINTWECVAILCTGKEYLDNIYLKFLQNIVDTIDINISTNLHLKLITKTSDQNKYQIPNSFYPLFASAEIISIDLPDALDLYDDKHGKTYDADIIKQYGSKYGPNFIFFETMKRLTAYNTTLLLECDCILLSNWMQRIHNYIGSQSLLVSGSQADSPNDKNFHDIRNTHINGGTAIYATGHDLFQKFIRLCENLWPVYIEHKSVDLPYDYLLLLILEDQFNNVTSKDNRIVWSYIKKHYLYTTLISNWSDTTYTDYSPRSISHRSPMVILHQKPPFYPGLFYS